MVVSLNTEEIYPTLNEAILMGFVNFYNLGVRHGVEKRRFKDIDVHAQDVFDQMARVYDVLKGN